MKKSRKKLSLERSVEKKLLKYVAMLNRKFMKGSGKALYTTGTVKAGLIYYPFSIMCRKEPVEKI